MKAKTHKPGIHENFLLTRHLKLVGLDNSGIDTLIEQLHALPQVDEASIRIKGKGAVLTIGYDASTQPQPLDAIQQVLASMDVAIAADGWTRFKLRYYATTDENVYENARHKPSCCSKVPPGK